LLGEKWEEGETCFSFFVHWPPNNGSFQGPPSNGTFHWPPNWDIFSPPSFSFSLKGEFGSFEALFSRHNLWFKSWEHLFPQPSLGGKEWLILVDVGKRGNRLDVYNCCNPNLGLVTKAQACKAGPRVSLGVTFHALGNAREWEEMNPHTPKWAPS